MDAGRCISYLTIEYKGEFTGDQERMVGHHLYGCDICQEVCPYNDRIPTTPESGFFPSEHFSNTLGNLEGMGQEEFEQIRENSPMERIGWDQWQRNLKACRKNTHSTG
jgi:epoxyqueuosine reductase